MDKQQALIAFDALSQETRLEVFRLLVKAGPEGVAAGAISEALHVPHNSLSFHLNHMSHARLVGSRRQGRSIIYSANYEFINELLRFMVEDCCGGRVGLSAGAAGAAGNCGSECGPAAGKTMKRRSQQKAVRSPNRRANR
jgi:ArsR family transcriptional regulator